MKRCILFTFAMAVVALASRADAQHEFPKPGPEHEKLKIMEGEWVSAIKMIDPESGKTHETTGSMSAKVDLDGFFLISKFKGSIGELPYEGRSITGYDPHKKKYIGVWVDSMGPGVYHTEGEWDKAGKEYKESMEGPGPDGKPMHFRSVTTVDDDDHMTFTLFMKVADAEVQMMEIKHARKK